MFVPTIFTNRNGVDQREDIFSSQLADDGLIYLTGEITDEQADIITAQVQWWAKRNCQRPLTLVINSPGGSVSAGFAIYDTLRLSGCQIHTYARGMAASMAAFLLATAGSPGCRFITPEAQVMIHQPIGGITGQATDIGIVAEHIGKIKTHLTALLAARTGKSCEEVAQACERNTWMDAQQALEYGLVDRVASSLPHTLV